MDYGGTIDTNGLHWSEVIYAAYNHCGIDIVKDDFREAYVYAERKMEQENLVKSGNTFRDVMVVKISCQFDFLSEKSRLALGNDEIQGVADYCYNYAKKNIEGQKRTLERLSEKYPLVVVSNFYGNLTTVLLDFGIDKYFHAVVESSVVGVRKPNSHIFLLGAQSLGVEPENCVVIGDSYKNDIFPGKRIGCSTIWLKGTGWETEEPQLTIKSNYTIHSLEEAYSILVGDLINGT